MCCARRLNMQTSPTFEHPVHSCVPCMPGSHPNHKFERFLVPPLSHVQVRRHLLQCRPLAPRAAHAPAQATRQTFQQASEVPAQRGAGARNTAQAEAPRKSTKGPTHSSTAACSLAAS